MAAMTSPVQVPPTVRRHRSFDAFAGAHRVVFEQVRVFVVDPEFTMPALAGVSAEVRCGGPEHSRKELDYYDTADLDLAANGLAVRWDAQEQDWTAVLPAESISGAPVRCEVGFPGTADVVPEAVERLLNLHLHRRPIEKVARVASRRTTRPLITRTGIRVADVIDERVVATAADGTKRTYRCIRVEVLDLDGVGRIVLADVCALLARSGCGTEAPPAELVRAVQ